MIKFLRNIVLLVLAVANSVVWAYNVPDQRRPEQVHLSYGAGPEQMYVTWLTFERTGTPTVEYGTEVFNYTLKALGKSTNFTTGKYVRFIHRTLLTELKHQTVYYYHVGSVDGGWSDMFRFKTRPADQENWSPRIGLYGDMANYNGISVPFLQRQITKNAYDAIFHVGDIAYDLQSNEGVIGDLFMREMESIAAYVPYQVVVGNHEEDERNFTDYNNRFTMINEVLEPGTMNNHFYSFNIGPAHVIGFSSEFYYFSEYGLIQIHNQYTWLERDLQEANKPENRKKRPWIIAMAHRPMYCSTTDADDCTQNESILRKGIPIVNRYGLEDLFYKYGVDLIIGAHEHTYERLYPVYDRKVYPGSPNDPYKKPKAPVHLLVGSAGCPELIDPFIAHPKPWSAKRITAYGITEMVIVNKTHIRIKQRETVQSLGNVVDTFTLVKGKWN